LNRTSIQPNNTKSNFPTKLGLLALAIMGSHISMAADEGMYAGFNVGRSQTDIKTDPIVNQYFNQGFTTTSLKRYEEDNGFKLFLGYQFTPMFALEAGYFSLGEFGYQADLSPASSVRGKERMRGANVDLVAFIPMSETMSLFGRVGATYAQTRTQFNGHGTVPIDWNSRGRHRDTDYKFGFGLQFDLSNALALRVEAERYNMIDAFGSNGNAELYSVGLVYNFGAQATVRAPAPAPVAAAPRATPPPAATPAPAPAPAPAPTPTRVSVSADSLFGFNSSVVSQAGIAELDKLVADLRGVDFTVIMVVGHTDRIGSQASNQRLSLARANAVRDYLVRSPNISAAQVTTRGVGSSEPVTTMAQCPDTMPRAQLITCIAPDRRVEVEVTGTRAPQ
jgi:OmpA-OmpF porin, OOP family